MSQVGDAGRSDGRKTVAAGREVAVLAGRSSQPGDELVAEVAEVDDRVDHQLRCQAEQVDVLLVEAALLLDEGLALRGVVDGGDLVGEDGVHRRLGPHHRDLGGGQRDGGLGFERRPGHRVEARAVGLRSEEHTSELQSLMRISYAVFCLKKKKKYMLNCPEKI